MKEWDIKNVFYIKLHFFRTRYNKALLESMLDQTFSTVCISENKTVVRIFRKISEKFEYFFFIFEALSEDSFNNTIPDF